MIQAKVDAYARRDCRLVTESTPSWVLSCKDYPMTLNDGDAKWVVPTEQKTQCF